MLSWRCEIVTLLLSIKWLSTPSCGVCVSADGSIAAEGRVIRKQQIISPLVKGIEMEFLKTIMKLAMLTLVDTPIDS